MQLLPGWASQRSVFVFVLKREIQFHPSTSYTAIPELSNTSFVKLGDCLVCEMSQLARCRGGRLQRAGQFSGLPLSPPLWPQSLERCYLSEERRSLCS